MVVLSETYRKDPITPICLNKSNSNVIVPYIYIYFKVPMGLSLIEYHIYCFNFLFLNIGQYLDCSDKAMQIKALE